VSLVARLRRAVLTPPSRRAWAEAAAGLALLGLPLALLGLASGELAWSPVGWPEAARIAAIAFFVPALGEELVFRAAMIPDRQERPSAAWPIVLSTVAFVLWHVLETVWLPGAAATFLRPEFLAVAGVLGLGCACLRRRSGSVWTAIAVHWAVVVAWQACLGGPGFAASG